MKEKIQYDPNDQLIETLKNLHRMQSRAGRSIFKNADENQLIDEANNIAKVAGATLKDRDLITICKNF